jgi:hypothetical protein
MFRCRSTAMMPSASMAGSTRSRLRTKTASLHLRVLAPLRLPIPPPALEPLSPFDCPSLQPNFSSLCVDVIYYSTGFKMVGFKLVSRQKFGQKSSSGALYPSKSGLINKHTVKHTKGEEKKCLKRTTFCWLSTFRSCCPVPGGCWCPSRRRDLDGRISQNRWDHKSASGPIHKHIGWCPAPVSVWVLYTDYQ